MWIRTNYKQKREAIDSPEMAKTIQFFNCFTLCDWHSCEWKTTLWFKAMPEQFPSPLPLPSHALVCNGLCIFILPGVNNETGISVQFIFQFSSFTHQFFVDLFHKVGQDMRFYTFCTWHRHYIICQKLILHFLVHCDQIQNEVIQLFAVRLLFFVFCFVFVFSCFVSVFVFVYLLF